MSTTLAIQSWILYATATSLIFSRIIFRRVTLGAWTKLQADDWLMTIVLIPFTAVIVLTNLISEGRTAKDRKYRYVLEELQVVTTWMVKACILVLYWRIVPFETEPWRRRTLKAISAFCGISYIIVQVSLFAWCRPTASHWDPATTNLQCTSYNAHTITTLALNIPDTIFVILLPVPFIPTPRRLLLAILLMIGTLMMISGIIARTLVLTKPSSLMYLYWFTSESTLGIIFANLPFLTPLFVTKAPARIRNISQSIRASSHVALSQWPRSRRGSWVSRPVSPVHMARVHSNATLMSELNSPTGTDKASHMGFEDRKWGYTEPSSVRNSASSVGGSMRRDVDELPSPSVAPPLERLSLVPKTRLSGGLAEMGDISRNNTEGWPIYWQ